jgi:D-3-phosphoglycerate dehydrogenase / 2-oxoglutarate reductase
VEDRDAPRILITEPLAEVGMDLLRRELPEALVEQRFRLAPAQLRAVIGGYTALIIRSETRVTADLLAAATRLQVIGRAGSGVDNIDLEAAGRRGVLVVHAPGGNVLATAEHTIALLLALARHIPAASGSLKAGRWEKSRFVGVELSHKPWPSWDWARSAGKWPGSRRRSRCGCWPVTPLSLLVRHSEQE